MRAKSLHLFEGFRHEGCCEIPPAYPSPEPSAGTTLNERRAPYLDISRHPRKPGIGIKGREAFLEGEATEADSRIALQSSSTHVRMSLGG